LTDEDSAPLNGETENLQSERIVIDLWTPIWSNLAFVGVVMFLGCVYVARKDF